MLHNGIKVAANYFVDIGESVHLLDAYYTCIVYLLIKQVICRNTVTQPANAIVLTIPVIPYDYHC